MSDGDILTGQAGLVAALKLDCSSSSAHSVVAPGVWRKGGGALRHQVTVATNCLNEGDAMNGLAEAAFTLVFGVP